MNAAAIKLRRDERWHDGLSPIRRFSTPMALIAFVSLLGHSAIVGTAVLSDRAVATPSTEISVEIVTEVPKTSTEARKPAKLAQAQAAAPKIEPAKVEAQPTDAQKTETKSEPAKPETTKPELAKSEPAKPERAAPKPLARQADAKADAPEPEAKASPKLEDEEQKLAKLQNELASLRAEQAALAAERAAATPQPIGLRDTGLGPLPASFQAVALPAASDGAGEAVGYQAIVFSALAKAKGFGRTKGLPGTAGVHFEIDAAGHLAGVALVHRSGVPSLDAEALDIVRRAAPFPPPPQGAQRSFDANVNFVTESAR